MDAYISALIAPRRRRDRRSCLVRDRQDDAPFTGEGKQREIDAAKREKLFSDFISEATRHYGDAISHQKDDVSDLALLYALVAQMRPISSRRVVEANRGVISLQLARNLRRGRYEFGGPPIGSGPHL
ncbi:hypothetical protein ACVJBD_006649 [Rhizobium mongolense]